MAIAPPQALNGRPRKQLSDQLDRLDDVINGMEEFLPQAVAEAARDGIRQAFRDVIGELVADPAVLDKLRSAIGPEIAPPAPNVSLFARLKSALRAAAHRVAAMATGGIAQAASLPARLASVARQCVRSTKTRLARGLLLALPIKSIVTIGLVVGVVVATISYIAPHHVAAMIGGFGASMTAMGLQVARWFRGQGCALAN